jgi:hypothetical protein
MRRVKIEIWCDACGVLIAGHMNLHQRQTPSHGLQEACSRLCAEELLRRDGTQPAQEAR